MLKIHPLAVNIGCATSFIQAGQAATAAALRKRQPQKTNSGENGTAVIASSTSATNKAPLVVYASDSSPTNSNQASSPTITSRSVLFVVLSGASAFSIIILALVITYRRYKAHKLGISRPLYPTEEVRVGGGRPSIEKSQIRHVTHDEQKERYRSLFGVPAGYLRPKSRVSFAPQPTLHSPQGGRYSSSPSGIRDDLDNNLRPPSSLEIHSDNGTSLCQFVLADNEPFLDRRDRNTRGISFVDESPRQICTLRSGDKELRISRFHPGFPNLLTRLKSIKTKQTIYKGKPINRITPYSLSTQSTNDFRPNLVAVAEVASEQSPPRPPSIAPTPPSYIKSASDENIMIQKPLDLAIVTDRLERQVTVQRPSFRGRGDSYYWKSPPRSE